MADRSLDLPVVTGIIARKATPGLAPGWPFFV